MKTKEVYMEKLFNIFNIALMLLLTLITITPFIHTFAKSLSEEYFVLAKKVYLIPKGFTWASYQTVLRNVVFRSSMMNSIFLITVGTGINIIITILCAYPLSRRKSFPGQKVFMILFIFTMFFNGGIIPTYMIVKNTGLMNKLWALILPNAVNPFNLIIMKNFFMSIPDSLEEAAEIDGASKWRCLFTIMIPLSKSAIATLSLFYAVAHWNSYFNALMYITDRFKYPLQLYLREIIISVDSAIDGSNAENAPTLGVKSATMFISMIPILMVYPFVQKYFVKGIMVGAVKG